MVRDFRAALPAAEVLVVDNASTDGTARAARAAGATRRLRAAAGQGVRAALRLPRRARDADYFVMVDGDDTYPAEDAAAAARRGRGGRRDGGRHAPRRTPRSGRLPRRPLARQPAVHPARARCSSACARATSSPATACSRRRFLAAAPLIAQGFEVEAELSLQARGAALPRGRGAGALPRAAEGEPVSKLQTYRDGTRILLAILTFFRDYKPLAFFGTLALVLPRRCRSPAARW